MDIPGVCPGCGQSLDSQGYCNNDDCNYYSLKRPPEYEPVGGNAPFPWATLTIVGVFFLLIAGLFLIK